MHLCLKYFPPTPLIENYLEAWIRSQGDKYYYNVHTLHDTQEHGIKSTAPSPEEITAESAKSYSQVREPITVPRPTLSQPTAIDAVAAINQTGQYRAGADNAYVSEYNQWLSQSAPQAGQ